MYTCNFREVLHMTNISSKREAYRAERAGGARGDLARGIALPLTLAVTGMTGEDRVGSELVDNVSLFDMTA